ncbi:hypothetical protein UC8_02230 [Roseimaritima ulvae]|uniref:Uncharacterized protein n=1 Tax=Roseimaritima ulvae TaxID=980254 RepID=A0A5B9QGU3_9BACT|nr:hypothetical protein UC8_02230 [Roseimaritima ulvae]
MDPPTADRYRIVFVVVAARTPNAQPQKILANVIDHVFVHQVNVVIDVVPKASCDGQVSGGDHAFAVGCRGLIMTYKVAGQLQPHKIIKCQIAVECVDHPVAITPGMGQGTIGVFTRGVRITHHVQPMPPPFFTVLRRSQQAIDQRCQRVLRGIGNKPFDFLGRPNKQAWRGLAEYQGRVRPPP